MSRVGADLYWSRVFAIPAPDFLHPGIFVVPHAKLAGFHGAWVFRKDLTWVISAPPRLVDDLRKKVKSKLTFDLQSPQGIHYLFGEIIDHTVGPAYQGYLDPDHFHPRPSHLVREITAKDRPGLKELIQPCRPVEWEHSGLSIQDKHLFGCFLDNRLVAAAGNIMWDPNTANPGVITHPDHRGKGYGTAVVSAAVQRAIKQDYLVLYQTLLTNTPAVKIAQGLGFQQYAQHVAVIFKSDLKLSGLD